MKGERLHQELDLVPDTSVRELLLQLWYGKLGLVFCASQRDYHAVLHTVLYHCPNVLIWLLPKHVDAASKHCYNSIITQQQQ